MVVALVRGSFPLLFSLIGVSNAIECDGGVEWEKSQTYDWYAENSFENDIESR